MNFLIYMVGRMAGEGPGGRPTPRQLILGQAARQAAAGELGEALKNYRRLGRVSGLTAVDVLVRAHLHWMLGHGTEAHEDFSRGADRLLSRGVEKTGDRDGATSVERLLGFADDYLRRGRFVRATELLQEARTLLDLLMGALAGVALAEVSQGDHDATARAAGALMPLAKLSDISLRLLARTHLATHVADSLRRRHLRDDLAPWATTAQSVDTLLESEYERLTAACKALPQHAESHFRLGLVARATNRPEYAAVAFARTLRLHPHHVPSAARLAATLLQLKRPAGVREALEKAFHVPGETLRVFGDFARTAGETGEFDAATDRLCATVETESARSVTRANLAFALSELAILDPVRSAWREAVTSQ